METSNSPQPKKKSKAWIIGVVILLVGILTAPLMPNKPKPAKSSAPEVENLNDGSKWHCTVAKDNFVVYLKQNVLKDPDSFELIEYSSVYDEQKQKYSVILKYRAKNSFGGFVIEKVSADVELLEKSTKFYDITKLE